MGLFKKKADPFSERTRALNAQIAALEAKIQKLDAQSSQPQSHPKLRPAAMPYRAGTSTTHASQPAPKPVSNEPVFEEVDQNKLTAKRETASTPEHYNELGVRKYDLRAFIERIKKHFNPPPTSNPKLVTLLATGSFQGLRPLRYEKRVARNRFIVLVTIFFLALLGILLVFLKNH